MIGYCPKHHWSVYLAFMVIHQVTFLGHEQFCISKQIQDKGLWAFVSCLIYFMPLVYKCSSPAVYKFIYLIRKWFIVHLISKQAFIECLLCTMHCTTLQEYNNEQAVNPRPSLERQSCRKLISVELSVEPLVSKGRKPLFHNSDNQMIDNLFKHHILCSVYADSSIGEIFLRGFFVN